MLGRERFLTKIFVIPRFSAKGTSRIDLGFDSRRGNIVIIFKCWSHIPSPDNKNIVILLYYISNE